MPLLDPGIHKPPNPEAPRVFLKTSSSLTGDFSCLNDSLLFGGRADSATNITMRRRVTEIGRLKMYMFFFLSSISTYDTFFYRTGEQCELNTYDLTKYVHTLGKLVTPSSHH